MLDRLGAWCADVAVDHRRLVLFLTGLLLVLGVYPAVVVPFDAAAEIWFLEKDPARLAYDQFRNLFGNDEFLMVAVQPHDGTVFENSVLESIERTTRYMETLPQIRSVESLTRYESLRAEGGDLALRPTVPRLPMSREELDRARASVLHDPLAVPTVASRDGRVGVVLADLVHRPGEFRYRLALVDSLEVFLRGEQTRSGLRYDILGGPVLDRDVYRKTRGDFGRNVPLVAGIIFLMLLFSLRSFTGSVLPLVTVIGAIIVARLAIPLLGWRDNNMLMIVPLVVLAVGIADSVHIVVHTLRLRASGFDGREAARQTVRVLFRPCFLTTFTTAIGFLSLVTASLAPLRELGVITTVGVGAALVFSVFSLPAALSLMRGDFGARRSRLEGGVLARATAGLPRFVETHRVSIFVFAAIATVVGLLGIPRLRVETNAIEFFARDDPIRVVGLEMEKKVGGIGSLEVVVHACREGGILDPDVLRAMDDLQDYVRGKHLVSGSRSVVDYLKAVNQAMHDGNPAAHRVPDSAALAAQYLLLYEASSPARGLDRFLDLTRTDARVSIQSEFGGSLEYRALQDSMEAFVDRRFPDTVTVEYTGIVTLYKNMGDYIIRSQIRSFRIALLLITLTLVITFRSLRMGLLSLIPNVWPIVLTVGFMGWRGILLEPSTAMVAAVSIGIAVDDSIHFLHKYRDAIMAGAGPYEAVRHAFAVSGHAIVFTTVILLAGFLVVGQSQFKPYVNFGYLCAMAIALALLGDLFILPAIFIHGSGRSRKPPAAATLLTLAVLLLLPAAVRGDPAEEAPGRGRAIMEAVEKAGTRGVSERIRVVIVLRDKAGREARREATMSFYHPPGKTRRSLIRFLAPATIAGTAFLTWEKNGPDDQWLYLPALGRVKRIAASGKTGTFAGTEFTYEDLGGRDLDEYEHRLVREETIEGEAADVVESIPRDEESGYSRILSWVSRERRVILRAEYYDRRGALLKRSTASQFEKADGVWRFKRVVMENLRTGRSTEMIVEERDPEAGLTPDDFTIESLEGDW